MPFIKLYTTLSKDKLPERFMPQLVEELSVIISKDKKWFNWILETDKCMSKGPDNEGAPYIWMEFRSIRTFDSKDNCKELCPKLFDAVIKLSGLTKEQIHILMGPLEPLQMGHEGAILG